MGSTAAASAASFAEVTGTNTQESGVDELDRIDADAAGNFYILDGRHLVVANGLPPAELRKVAELDLSNIGQPQGLMLDEAKAQLVIVLAGRAAIIPVSNSLVAPEIWLQDGEADPVRLTDPTCGAVATPDVSMPFALTMVTSVDTDGTNVNRLAITNNTIPTHSISLTLPAC